MKSKLLLIICMLFLFSCTKDTVTPSTPNNPPPTQNKPTIQFINNSNNPYFVYLDGYLFFTQSGKTSVTKTLTPGTFTIDVIQKSGYVLYPTERTYKVTLDYNQDKVLSYP